MLTVIFAAAGLAEISPEEQRAFVIAITIAGIALLLVSVIPTLIAAAFLWRLILKPIWNVARGRPID